MNVFSLAHFIYLFICASICVLFYFIFKNKSYKTKYIAILVPLTLAFIIHFLKLLIPYYRNELPQSIMSITPETLCAFSTLAFPFIYLSKNKFFKDYMVIFGIVSGFATLIIPGDILGLNPLSLEVMRFFFAHLVIFLAPFFMYVFNIYRPKEKKIKHTLLALVLILVIITINNIIFTFALYGKEDGLELLKSLGFIKQHILN